MSTFKVGDIAMVIGGHWSANDPRCRFLGATVTIASPLIDDGRDLVHKLSGPAVDAIRVQYDARAVYATPGVLMKLDPGAPQPIAEPVDVPVGEAV